MSEIRFYRVQDKYGSFSNFAPYPVRLDGKRWPTSEHYFQAQKFTHPGEQEAIRLTKSPMEAARMGRDRSWSLRPDWEEAKDEVMREVVWAKFTQHNSLRELLLSTGDATIVEHTKNDCYWADGGAGKGKNMLGRILMEARERIRRVDSFSCTEEWEEAHLGADTGISSELWSERVDLRDLLWEKHVQSLPPEEQELLNEGNHPSFGSHFAGGAAAVYAESLKDSLSSLDHVADVTLDAYHGDTFVLTVWLNQSLSWREYRPCIPELFMGFQVFVAPPINK
ncbi:MAG: NADAR family protein [Desulfomonile tiedjei]|uniref:NADAR family protein n=1 Tax=Desulfomonile tiedjei TaxID=2358 RepID=A0A9D6V6L5_9BACT|nr:NADAR family protein [Desulfomonile tiedjei]